MKPKRVRLLVDVQYPPHRKPVAAGRVVDDYPLAALAGDVKLGWVEVVTEEPPAPAPQAPKPAPAPAPAEAPAPAPPLAPETPAPAQEGQ